jgi:hypothetical protein
MKKYTDIQNVFFNEKKATRYKIMRLIDGAWHYSGTGTVFGWFKTSRGINNQIAREEGV